MLDTFIHTQKEESHTKSWQVLPISAAVSDFFAPVAYIFLVFSYGSGREIDMNGH